MVNSLNSLGGVHTLEDFAQTNYNYCETINGFYEGYELIEHPPNGQGATALLMANILSNFDLKSLEPFGIKRTHIETEAAKQMPNELPIEIHHKMSNSNISMSLQNKVDETKYNENLDIDSARPNEKIQQDKNNFNIKESFPSVSLSVKNPISSKILVGMIFLQVLSNIGILYFLFVGME